MEPEPENQTKKVSFAVQPGNDVDENKASNGTNGQIRQFQSRRNSDFLYVDNKK